jgi:hypothetical protein
VPFLTRELYEYFHSDQNNRLVPNMLLGFVNGASLCALTLTYQLPVVLGGGIIGLFHGLSFTTALRRWSN